MLNQPPSAPQRAPQPAAQQGEPLVRYCPGCGSIGPVEAKYRDCCPDGNEARLIPQALAEKCRDTFRIAIGNLTAAHPSTPAAKANTALHKIIAGVEAALDAAGAPAGTLVERIGALAKDAEDARRLDWLTFNISGKALRDIGVIWSEHGDARRAIDAARTQQDAA